MKNLRLYASSLVGVSALFYLYEFFIRVLPGIFSTEIMDHFDVHATGFGIIASAFFLAYVPMQIPAGLLGDRFGPRRILTLMTALVGLSCILFVHAQSWQGAAFARAMVGFGASFAYLAPLMLAARWLPARLYALTAGLIQAMGCLGAILGTKPIALIAEHYGWLPTLNAAGYFGFFLSLLMFFFIKDRPPKFIKKKKKIDVIHNLKIIAQNKQSWWIAFLGLAAWAPMSIFTELWATPFFKQALHITTSEAAYDTSWVWIGVAIGGPMFALLSQRLKRRKTPLVFGLSLSLLASIGIIYFTHMPQPLLLFSLLCLGLGCGVQAVTFGAIGDHNTSETAGTAAGLNNMAVVLGGVLLQPLAGYLLDVFNPHATGHVYPVHAYHLTFLMIPAVIVLGIATILFCFKETYATYQGTS